MKNNPYPSSYILPNATILHNNQCQFYKGDFFTLLITQPASPELHAQFNLSHPITPGITILTFKLPTMIFELHITNDVLVDYESLQLSSNVEYITTHYSLATEENLMAFFDGRLAGGLADRFLYARVVSLLVHLTREAAELSKLKSLPASILLLAEEVHRRILSDLSEFETVEQLARKAGTSKQILQAAFRQRFGTTVGQFSRAARLKHARHLLDTTNDTLLSIALSVGYSDPANFSTAFKTHFGHSPRQKKYPF